MPSSCILELNSGIRNFCLQAVCAHPRARVLNILLKELAQLSEGILEPWVLRGDFSAILLF
jgi:hypothetical protein